MSTRTANIVILLIFSAFIIYQIDWSGPAATNQGPANSVASNLVNVAINIVSGIILLILLQLFKNIYRLGLYYQTKIRRRNKSIRVSMSYLFRIKVNDKYLLVRNRTKPYFQPVGGAYKSLPGSESIFQKLRVTDDRIIETGLGVAKRDLRLYVTGKYLINLLDWFDSRRDRETSPWREFCEELITTNIVPFEKFHNIDYKYIKTITTPIIKLDHGDEGLYLYEVYDLLPNTVQTACLEQLQAEGNKESYIWASEYHIKRLGHDEGSKSNLFLVGRHAKWALDLKWSNI